MKTLVVYYSRSNVTRKLAESLAEDISADLEEIQDTQNRKGIWGFLKSGYQASQKKLTRIMEPKMKPSDYDLVIIGTPIWAGKMSVPVRTYLHDYGEQIKELALFCTYNSSGFEDMIEEFKVYSGKDLKATLGVTKKLIDEGEYQQVLSGFISKLG